MIKAVLFDLDGTLTNSLKDLAIAVNYAITKNGYPEQSIDKFNMFVGDGMLKMVERAIAPSTVSQEKLLFLKEEFMQYYSQHYADYTSKYDGIDDLLEYLKNKGIKVGVVTNKDTNMAIALLNKLYNGAFSVVVGKEDNLAAKPAPDGAFKAMEQLKVKPQECLFLGDSGVDMKTALNCGATAVGVLWGFRGREELVSNGAEFIVKKPLEVKDIIEGKR